MKVTTTDGVILRMTELDALDPVTVLLKDDGPGKGGINIECWGECWCAYWCAMGCKDVVAFFCEADSTYLLGKLAQHKATAHQIRYLKRIIEAVQGGLALWEDRATP